MTKEGCNILSFLFDILSCFNSINKCVIILLRGINNMNKLKNLFKRIKNEKIDSEVDEPITTLEFEEIIKQEAEEHVEEVLPITKDMVQQAYKTFLQLFQQSSKRYYIILYLVLAKDQNRSFLERLNVIKNAMKEITLQEVYFHKAMDRIEYELLPPSSLIEDTFHQVEHTNQNIKLLQEDMSEFERLYYRDIKIATMSVLIEKSYTEVQTAYKDQQYFIREHKSLKLAAEYVYFHSGDLIVETVKALVNCIEMSRSFQNKTKIDLSYFLKTDAVITLDLTEWLSLFSKIRYILRQSASLHPLSYAQFKQLYRQLETHFLMLMIYMEKTKENDLSSIRKFNI